jgi:hypothetical protein
MPRRFKYFQRGQLRDPGSPFGGSPCSRLAFATRARGELIQNQSTDSSQNTAKEYAMASMAIPVQKRGLERRTTPAKNGATPTRIRIAMVRMYLAIRWQLSAGKARCFRRIAEDFKAGESSFEGKAGGKL